MKTLKSLKNIGKPLSRNEMRNIAGGIVSPGGGGFSNTINLGSGSGGSSDKGCGDCYSAYDCGDGCNMCNTPIGGGKGYCSTFKIN